MKIVYVFVTQQTFSIFILLAVAWGPSSGHCCKSVILTSAIKIRIKVVYAFYPTSISHFHSFGCHLGSQLGALLQKCDPGKYDKNSHKIRRCFFTQQTFPMFIPLAVTWGPNLDHCDIENALCVWNRTFCLDRTTTYWRGIFARRKIRWAQQTWKSRFYKIYGASQRHAHVRLYWIQGKSTLWILSFFFLKFADLDFTIKMKHSPTDKTHETKSHTFPMDPFRSLWIRRYPYGSAWVPMDTYGSPWVLVHPYGSLLIQFCDTFHTKPSIY